MTVKNKTVSGRRPNRVVVTVDVEDALSHTLELAIALAIASESELHGLFIEDQDLLHAASLPFSCEVMLGSGRPRILDNTQLLRTLEARSRRFRESLANLADRSALSWTYSKVQGRTRSLELTEFTGAQFLIIGQPTTRTADVAKPVRVLLVCNGNQRLYQALDVVLANCPQQPVELLLVSKAKSPPQDNLKQLTDRLEARQYSSLTQINPDLLTACLTRKNQPVDYVIVSRSEPEFLQQVMQNSVCPVIVVS